MTLKYQVKTLDGLDEAVAGMYKKDGDVYVLAVDGLPQVEDTSALKSALDHEREKRKRAVEDAQQAREAAQQAADEKARKDGDIQALEDSWKAKLAKLEKDKDGEIQILRSALDETNKDATATALATELAVPGSAKTLRPHIHGRLKVEIRDGKAVTVVLDSEGKPSAMSLEDLKKEIQADPAFSPVLVASKAAGGGAAGGKGGGAAGGNVGDMGGSKEERLAAIKNRMAATA